MSRERASDLEMLLRLAPPAGLDVLDVGCGSGALVRELRRRGARPVGIEVSEDQLGDARATDPGGRYLIGRAEELPVGDGTLDLVVFMRSLHHVPMAAMAPALAEARRVLRPGGALYVAEPLPEGEYFELTLFVEDERRVRRAAQEALAGAAAAGLQREATVEYEVEVRIEGPAELRRRMLAADPRRAARFEAHEAHLAEALRRLGARAPGDGETRLFLQPMRADLLRAV